MITERGDHTSRRRAVQITKQRPDQATRAPLSALVNAPTVGLDTWVLGHARRVAAEQGTSLSAWLSEAAKWHVARHDFARVPDPTNDERFEEAVRRQEAEEAQRRRDDDRRRIQGRQGAA